MPEFTSSRFLVRDKPMAYPYYDLIIQDSLGPVFDLGVTMDSYDGSVYLRFEHVIEMARTLGMGTVEEVKALRDEVARLQEQVYRVPKAQEELTNGINDLVASFNAGIISVDDGAALLGIEKSVESDREPAEAERKSEPPFSL